MSGLSAPQYMAQPNPHNSSIDLSSPPVKRKRGRPRKDETSSSDHIRRQKRRLLPSSSSGLVGQEVSGVLDGVFDAGYLLTVRVGDLGPVLRGMVFDPRFSVPVSAENDIAPHLPMLKRDEISAPVSKRFANRGSSHAYVMQNAIPVEPIQAKEPPTRIQVTPSNTTHVPQIVSQIMEPKSVSEISHKGAAGENSELLLFPQSEVKDDKNLILKGPSNFLRDTFADSSKPLAVSKETPNLNAYKLSDISTKESASLAYISSAASDDNKKEAKERMLELKQGPYSDELGAEAENLAGSMGHSSQPPAIAVMERPAKGPIVPQAPTTPQP